MTRISRLVALGFVVVVGVGAIWFLRGHHQYETSPETKSEVLSPASIAEAKDSCKKWFGELPEVLSIIDEASACKAEQGQGERGNLGISEALLNIPRDLVRNRDFATATDYSAGRFSLLGADAFAAFGVTQEMVKPADFWAVFYETKDAIVVVYVVRSADSKSTYIHLSKTPKLPSE